MPSWPLLQSQKLQFPKPQPTLLGLVGMLRDMIPFLTKKNVELENDFFDKAGLKLSFGMNPAYLQLPKYVGGKVLGEKGQVFEVKISEKLAQAMNTMKNPSR